ncbi:hypothetical protein [Streptomyces sp. AP-93]|uniref:hypothetical protein n=1 Tax=Streptomyces sp. AP-93 TaxID=2929048 RepID=UPI001FAED311|nr:hypothetical protein [Streptomyces sp. AP-93]MCJ0875835.1 hypothetical protein [Streptomyces sp. AP-93]
MTEHDILDFPGADELRAAGGVASPSAQAVEAALTAVRTAIAAEAGSATEDVVPLRIAARRRRLPRLLVSAAAVAVLAAGVAVYPVVGGGDGPAATATAAGFLREVAATAGERRPVAHAPYWKVRCRTGSSPRIKTSWSGRNRNVIQESEGDPVLEFPPPEIHSWLVGGKDVTWDDLPSLPTDAQELRTRLTGGAATTLPGFFGGAAQLLSRAPLETAVRSALFEVLADSPGLVLVGQVKDAAGRTGTAVEERSDERRVRMVLDPETGTLLEFGVYARGGPEGERPVVLETYLSAEPAWSIPPTVPWDSLDAPLPFPILPGDTPGAKRQGGVRPAPPASPKAVE